MRRERIEYQGVTYRYTLSLLDVFSRYHWLAPLSSKHSISVAREIEQIYKCHGHPQLMQSDKGKEFYGYTKKFCEGKRIGMIRS